MAVIEKMSSHEMAGRETSEPDREERQHTEGECGKNHGETEGARVRKLWNWREMLLGSSVMGKLIASETLWIGTTGMGVKNFL